MIAPGPNGWLFDTNVVIHLVRKSRTGAAFRSVYGVDTDAHPRYVCVVSYGEVEAFALWNDWGARRQQTLADTLAEFHGPLDISPRAVLDGYARIDAASRSIGRRMGKTACGWRPWPSPTSSPCSPPTPTSTTWPRPAGWTWCGSQCCRSDSLGRPGLGHRE